MGIIQNVKNEGFILNVSEFCINKSIVPENKMFMHLMQNNVLTIETDMLDKKPLLSAMSISNDYRQGIPFLYDTDAEAIYDSDGNIITPSW